MIRLQDNNKWINFKAFLLSWIRITWGEIWFLLLKRNTYKKSYFMEGNLYGAKGWYEKEKFNWVDNKTNASEFKSISEWKER